MNEQQTEVNEQQTEVNSHKMGVGHRAVYIRNNGNKALGIDILHYRVPGVGFKVFDVYNDALKSHIKRGDVIKFVTAYNDNDDWDDEEFDANRFFVDCRDLSFEEFHSKMSIVKGMQFISICVNQCGHIWSSDWRYNDRLYNDIYYFL